MRAKRPLFLGAFAVGIGLIVYLSLRSDEPRYGGRSLHSWLNQLEGGTLADRRNPWGAENGLSWAVFPNRTPKQMEAAKAIRALGTNAMPYLLSDLSAQGSSRHYLWEHLKNVVQTKWFKQTPSPAEPTNAERVRWKAALGLEVLGPDAVSIVPQITPLLQSTSSDSAAKSAAYLLGGMGAVGIAVLTNAVNSSNEWTALSAIWSMAQHRSAADTNWIPLLIEACTRKTNSTYWPLGGLGVWAIGEIRLDPERCIPFFTKMLSASDPNVRSQAASSLGKFGKDAAVAVPLLKELAKDQDSRWYAKEALEKIQKEAGDKP